MNANQEQHPTTIHFATDGHTLRHIPLDDIILATELRVATEQNIKMYRCPCRNCHGGQRKSIEIIRKHHALVGRH